MTSSDSPLNTAVLRPWTDSTEDVAAVLEAFDTDDMAGQSGEPVNSEAAARRWIAPWTGTGGNPAHAVAFAIDVGGRAVGNVMATAIEHRHNTAWISYWVTPAARGTGLASAATAALAGYCFDILGLHRLELAHRVNNQGSGRVALAAGFVAEGIERDKLCYLDETGQAVRFDVQTMARLASDPASRAVPLAIRS